MKDELSIGRGVRIGFDESPSNGGPGRYVRSMVEAVTRLDWDVTIVNVRDAIPPATPQTIQLPLPESRITKLRRRLLPAVPSALKMYAGFIQDAMSYSNVIASSRLDLMHAQRTGCEDSPVAARMAKVPALIGTFHVNSSLDLQGVRSGPVHRSLERFSNRCLHLAIAVSEATKQDWVRRSGIPSERVITIHNGIDPDQFVRRRSESDARGRLGLPRDTIILGGLGRLAPAKGFEYLIEAVAALRSDFPNTWVAIAGSGPLRESLEAKAEALGVSDRVVFLGFQSDVNLVLDACDVFVLSSLSEALPFALLEAMAHELPCIGTTVGGIPEVIVPGDTGFLAPPRDGIALAQAIRPLLESAELRERMGRAGRARVIKHFHEADMVRKTLDVYRRMLATRPNRRGGHS